MFYSQFILAKKGPLGTIWIAAHLERKLRKNQVADTDIGVSVDSILSPDVPIALRLSSHLLLGVVRIYSKKVNFLFDDCSDALLKVKQAFRSAAVDLPPEESTAPYHSITLPETFDLDDFELPDAADIFHGNYVDHHVSSRDQITLQDTMEGVVFSTSQFGHDERFGDYVTSGLDLDELDKLGQDADATVYAQAPCTPGLAEEPNLSTAQETSIFNDHQDLEDEPNFPDINEAEACKNHPDSEENCNTTKLSTEETMTEVANINLYSGMENGMDDTFPNDENPVEAMSLASKSQGGVLTSLGDVSALNNRGINNVMSELGSTILEIDHLSLEPRDSNGVKCIQDVKKSCHLSNSVPSNVLPDTCHRENSEIHASRDQNDPIILSSIVQEKVDIINTHVLQPCNNKLKETNPKSDVPETFLDEAPGRNDGPCLVLSMEVRVEDNQSAFCKSNGGDENVISMQPNPLDISNGIEVAELPEPEKLLSISGGHVDDQFHLLESTPNREHLVGGDLDDSGTNIISGKKRTFTESTLTVDTLNSVEPLEVVQSKRTKEYVPDDNDLLSSILVGRKYSVLKLKSTPPHPPQTTSKKRPRSTARISFSKRKVTVDDTMVLHGDQIRQQLTSTEDIRRIRKKAPCTRSEIWLIRREYLEEEIFTEPLFTVFSSGLASLYSETYDLNRIKLSWNESQIIREAVHNDKSACADSKLDKETDKDVNHESILARYDMELQSPERQEDKALLDSLPLVHSGEILEMHINEHINFTADAINPSIVNGIESNFSVDPVAVDKVNDLSNDVELDGSAAFRDQILETQFIDMDASMVNGNNVFPLGAEADVSVASSDIILTANDSHTGKRDQIHVMSVEGAEEFSEKASGFVNVVNNVEFDINVTVNGLGLELAEASTPHVELLNSNVHVSDNEYPGGEGNHFPNEMDPENVFVDHSSTIDHGDSEYNMDEHDTGFLNEDDDEITEEGEDCIPSAEHTGFNDNSGWSSRTRAVAKYLQVLFDKESEQGRKALLMNNLLVGKTRKEASRMFFEALVLKTRDYIQVEQEAPFENINMKPRVKLLKAEF